MFYKKNKEKGFTLIELLVVIAIIGILSAVVLASLNTARQKSRDARRIADTKQLQLALELYYDDNNGSYPAALAGVSPTHIPTIPLDPQGAAYTYAASASGDDYVLRADLEDTGHSALDNDIDGTVLTVDCADAIAGYYCIRP